MDIHKEHTAFLEFYVKEHTTAYDEVDTFYKGVTFVDPHVQHGFTIWLAAKQHAEQALLGKPAVKFQRTIGGFWHVFGGEYFDLNIHTIAASTKQEAIAWALAHGYRVVEE